MVRGELRRAAERIIRRYRRALDAMARGGSGRSTGRSPPGAPGAAGGNAVRARLAYLTQDEVRRLLREASGSPRDYAMLLLLYRHGLRASEVELLRRGDVDLERGRIVIRRLKNGEGGEHPLASDEVRALKRYLRTRRDGDEALFRSRQGGPVTRTQLFRLMREYCRRAGIPAEKAHPHALRHSAGVHRAEAGLDVRLIQDWLGHRNIRNTVVYTRISSPLRDEAYFRALASGKVV